MQQQEPRTTGEAAELNRKRSVEQIAEVGPIKANGQVKNRREHGQFRWYK